MIRTTIKKIGKHIGALLAFLVGISLTLWIWAAIIVAFRQIYAEWRIIRTGLLTDGFTCNLDTDCPTGYSCIGGRCVPAISKKERFAT